MRSGMQATVEFELQDGSRVQLMPGDVLGRLWTAACWIPDPRVSEAHAMVSLRGPVLKLLALRGRFSLGAGSLTELELAVGQQIWLADDLSLRVVGVTVPERVVALSGPDLPRQVILGVASLELAPRPRLRRGAQTGAAAVIWSDGSTWRLRTAVGERLICPGESFEVDGQRFDLLDLPLHPEAAVTRQEGGLAAPLCIEARHDTVHISQGEQVVLRLVGIQARMVSELALMAAPAPWRMIAQEIWPEETRDHHLRRRWDIHLTRIRRGLKGARLRTDLIKADGRGNYELVLYPQDRVIENV